MRAPYPWQTESWQALQGLRERLPNAILLKGAQGIGKLSLAQRFAQALLCEAPLSDGHPCRTCASCHWFEQGNHPDYRLVQPEALSVDDEREPKASAKKPSQEISVEQIRLLSDFSNLGAHRGGYRVVVIHPAESMNANSANSLLKTLEEPTENLFFILVTHKPQQLLPTIKSRCLSVAVPTPPAADSIAWLTQQGVSQPGQQLAHAGFAPLLAMQWHETGDDGSESRQSLLNGICQPLQMDALQLAETLQRASPALVVHCLQQWCYDLLSVKLTGVARYFPDQANGLRELANKMAVMPLLAFQKELQTARREASHPLQARLKFESLFLLYRDLFAN